MKPASSGQTSDLYGTQTGKKSNQDRNSQGSQEKKKESGSAGGGSTGRKSAGGGSAGKESSGGSAGGGSAGKQKAVGGSAGGGSVGGGSAGKERGRMPEGSEKHMPWGQGLEMHTKPWVRARASKEYWEKMRPAGGRPFCPAMSQPDNWGVTAGDKMLEQKI